MRNRILILTCFLIITTTIKAQREELLPRLSPNATVSQVIGYTTITINYCRPCVKDRKILGDLVPYNKVWRTGANESTTIQFTTDVIIEGNKIPAGIYSLWTVPTEEDWTIIINKDYKAWGLSYNGDEDFVRFQVKPEKANFTERLQFSFTDITDNSTVVLLNWEYFRVPFKIEINLTDQFLKNINDKIAHNPEDWSIYANAAQYAADHEFLLSEALNWIDRAISIKNVYTAYFIKAKVLYKMNKYSEALKVLARCREIGRNDKNWDSFFSQVDFLEKQIKTKMN